MVATLPKKDRQAPPFRAPKGGVKKNQVKCKRTARGTAPSPVVDAPIGAAIVLLVTVWQVSYAEGPSGKLYVRSVIWYL
jgi:hypothetical protein